MLNLIILLRCYILFLYDYFFIDNLRQVGMLFWASKINSCVCVEWFSTCTHDFEARPPYQDKRVFKRYNARDYMFFMHNAWNVRLCYVCVTSSITHFACSIVIKELLCAYLSLYQKHSLDFKAIFILFKMFPTLCSG